MKRKFWLKNQIKKRKFDEDNFDSYRDTKHHESVWNERCRIEERLPDRSIWQTYDHRIFFGAFIHTFILSLRANQLS